MPQFNILPLFVALCPTVVASIARHYIIVGSADYIVGATIGRPLLSLGRKSVTVLAQ